jgi:hypothetical protein
MAVLFSEIPKADSITDMSHQPISTDSLLQESRTFPPSPEVKAHALINAEQFNDLYERSVRDPEKFWLEQAGTLESPANSRGTQQREKSSTLFLKTAS